ncbi:hypothetical protein BGY98DRAFT_161852 [Russula aff. rugulosa BPL654]|nr:hypothetical protein BGY98DRAFT_161852 [Russula aff. rugulosa BPL654]
MARCPVADKSGFLCTYNTCPPTPTRSSLTSSISEKSTGTYRLPKCSLSTQIEIQDESRRVEGLPLALPLEVTGHTKVYADSALGTVKAPQTTHFKLPFHSVPLPDLHLAPRHIRIRIRIIMLPSSGGLHV